MRFTVLWTPGAEKRLAELWLDADDRDAITRATYEIDERLRVDPENQGESRDKARRFLVVPPLAAYFRVLVEDRKVYVLAVRSVRRRS